MTQVVPRGSRDETDDPDDHGGGRVDPDVDGDLLLAARHESERFGDFYDRNFASVFAYFYKKTACVEVSADLTAETFTAALSGIHRYRPRRGTGRNWLYGIAQNLFRQWLRKGRVETRARNRLQVSTPTIDAGDLERIERSIDLRPYLSALPGAIDSLSPAARDALVLRISEELPYAEIASRLGCSEISARVRVSRALDRLHHELDLP